jgi:hypothetical protein
LYEQRRVHHVGTFSALEDQLCSFTSDFDRARAGYSPDRLDALVWGLSELLWDQSTCRCGRCKSTSWDAEDETRSQLEEIAKPNVNCDFIEGSHR